ncbi:MAG: hypothetical protein IPM84_23875 [Anaerolineae bacterium]|nr:hypothetical protein [Anaerolineae bacterium]
MIGAQAQHHLEFSQRQRTLARLRMRQPALVMIGHRRGLDRRALLQPLAHATYAGQQHADQAQNQHQAVHGEPTPTRSAPAARDQACPRTCDRQRRLVLSIRPWRQGLHWVRCTRRQRGRARIGLGISLERCHRSVISCSN